MKKLLLFLLIPAFAAAQPPAQQFKLAGELKAFKPIDKIYLYYYDGENMVRDSFQTKDGSFTFQGTVTEPSVAQLFVKYVKAAGEERPRQEYMQVFLQPGKINVTAKDSIDNHTLSGSKALADFDKLQKSADAYSPRLQKLYADYGTARKASNKEEMDRIEKEIDAVDQEMKDKVYAVFVKNNPQSPVALYALKTYAGYDIDPVKVEPLFNQLPAASKQLPSAVTLKEQIDIAKRTAIGSYAMDFTQNDTLGNPVSLSSFKGKYVLVDFWASWCGPCRAENPNVVKAFNKFKDKDFTILSVSLDRPNAKEKWLKAIHDDGLAWNHVSDLKYWDNAVAKQYGIRAIPQNVLIDPQGKIIAKNLRGEDLEQKLGEVFPN